MLSKRRGARLCGCGGIVAVLAVVFWWWWWFIYTIHSTAEGGTKNSRSRGNKTNINNINTKETLPVHIFELKQGGFRCAAYAHCLASWPLVAVVSVGKSPPRKRGRRLHVRPGAGYREGPAK